MRPNIHPQYVECKVVCSCGNTFITRSIKPFIQLEICSKCHPFFTGQQKLVDTAGRVERFVKKYKEVVPISHKKKTLTLRKSKKPIISTKTHTKIQSRLKTKKTKKT